MNIKKRTLFALIVLVSSILLIACGEKVEVTRVVTEEVVVTATPEPAPERGNLRMTHFQQWAGKESFDPTSPTRFLPAIYFLYDRLLGRDEQGLAIPELAVSWEADATAQKWTFKLRAGVTFHDGKPFTSADVAYTFQHIFDPELESPTAAVFDDVGVRQALKLALDRQEMIDVVIQKHGSIAYDHPVWAGDPYQLVLDRSQDIEKARVAG